MTEDHPRVAIDKMLTDISFRLIAHWNPKEGGPRTKVQAPEAFYLEGTTIRLMLSDIAPDDNAPVWTVRFDGLEWKAWVRELQSSNVYGVSVVYQLDGTMLCELPDVNKIENHGRDWIVEFSPRNSSAHYQMPKALEDATDWLKAHYRRVPYLYEEFECGRLKRKILGFFG